jgi:transketolase
MTEALRQRPALIAPFVTRPTETVLDREHYGLPPATESRKGVYALRRSAESGSGTVVLQGSGVAINFVREVLPRLDKEGVKLNVFYVASAELFDALPQEEQDEIFPEAMAQEAMGVTGFTLPTLYRWVRSDRGRALSMYPFSKGHFLGSGQAESVLEEAGLDGESLYAGVRKYLEQAVPA